MDWNNLVKSQVTAQLEGAEQNKSIWEMHFSEENTL